MLYDPNRFNRVPVLIVDYQMPGMDGIEFCRRLKTSPILKIMLTAEADKDIAVKVFNERIIDKFILKTDKDLYLRLLQAIQELTLFYFNHLSAPIIGRGDLLKNPVYQRAFNEVKTKANAVEYYMVDYSGSFLFLDGAAAPTWMIVRNEKEIEDQVALLDGYGVNTSAIKNREKLLFLFSEIEHNKPAKEWVNYLLETKPLITNYYYSVSDKNLTEFIKWNKIVPYSMAAT